MGKKKPFINKKTAQHYSVVRRSQRDVGGYYDEDGSIRDIPTDTVLMPTNLPPSSSKKSAGMSGMSGVETSFGRGGLNSIQEEPNNQKKDGFQQAKTQLQQAGLVDDYDYDRHVKPMTGTGVFISGSTGKIQYSDEPQIKEFQLKEDIPSSSSANNASTTTRQNILEDPMIAEVNRQYDSIALSSDKKIMDDDIAQVLFGDYDEGDFEEILDDFCVTASEEPTNPTDGDPNESGLTSNIDSTFDYFAHVDELIQKAKREENGGEMVVPENHEWWQKQQMQFNDVKDKSKKKRVGDEDNDDDESLDSLDQEMNEMNLQELVQQYGMTTSSSNNNDHTHAPVLTPQQEKAAQEKFEQTLAEYDDDNIGDLDEECYDIVGDKPLEGDAQMDAIFDTFLEEKSEGVYVNESKELTVDGKDRSQDTTRILIGTKMVSADSAQAQQELEQEPKLTSQTVNQLLSSAKERLASPELDLPPEEVLIDGKSYFTMNTPNPWDCESILSTYSNLDNNPSVVGRGAGSTIGGRVGKMGSARRLRNKNRRKKNQSTEDEIDPQEEEEPVPQIQLSNKTGLPLNVLPTTEKHYEDDDTIMSVNRGQARNKNETKEEKKARKQAVKQERLISRLQKKMMKEVIDEEYSKRCVANVGSSDVAVGKSVFRL